MNLKKLLVFTLALLLLVALAACGGGDSEGDDTTAAPVVTTGGDVVTTTGAAVTTTEPAATTTAGGNVTNAPVTTTEAPDVTTTKPTATTTKPTATTTKPAATTTAAPIVTTTAPVVTTYPLQEQSAYASPVIDGKKDALYSHDNFKNLTFTMNGSFFWSAAGLTKDDIKTTVNASLAWDGYYLYVFVEVTDPTPMLPGSEHNDAISAYAATSNPYMLDSVELWYCYGEDIFASTPATKNGAINKVGASAYGWNPGAYASNENGEKWYEGSWTVEEQQAFWNTMEAVTQYTVGEDNTAVYTVEYKMPITKEDKEKLTVGDKVYLTIQLNDLQGVVDGTMQSLSYGSQYGNKTAFTELVLPEPVLWADAPLEEKGSYKAPTVDGVKDDDFYSAEYSFDVTDKQIWSSNNGVLLVQNTAKTYVGWDGYYIYAYVEVVDKTPVLPSSSDALAEYVKNGNPFQSDSVELWYYFNQAKANSNCAHKVGCVAYTDSPVPFANRSSNNEYGPTGWTSAERDAFWAEIQVATSYKDNGDGTYTYAIEYRMPAIGENGKALSVGDTVQFAIQVNDLQVVGTQNSGSDFQSICSGDRGENYTAFVLPKPELKAE